MDYADCVDMRTDFRVVTSDAGRTQRNESFFSTRDFIEAVSRSLGSRHRILAVPVRGSGPPRTIYALQTLDHYGLRSISLGPFGLYGSPGWTGQIETQTIEGILNRLKTIRTRGFVWNVRFDQRPLAEVLTALGLVFRSDSTHVLHLAKNYEGIYAGYASAVRNKIRKAYRMGVQIRDAHSAEDICAYYQVHTRLADQKGGYTFIYPIQLFHELIKIRRAVRLLVAEYEERVVAGGLFFLDGSSVVYWHGATDRNYSRCYPFYAVLDKALQGACESGAEIFDFGGSAGIVSLEKFKSFWGARPELYWKFAWTNPLWARLSRLKGKIVAQHA